MKKKLIILSACLSLLACKIQTASDKAAEEESMKKTDIDFSDLSQKEGMKKAFLQYMDSSTALLRPNHYPIIGEAAKKFIAGLPDSFVLTWKPSKAEVAASADIGYTFGIYRYQDKDTSFEGTYVSIWKKQGDGSWKYVLDSGNPGVDKQK